VYLNTISNTYFFYVHLPKSAKKFLL